MALAACGRSGPEEPVPGIASFSVNVSAEGGMKSLFSGNDSAINEYSLFVYDGGGNLVGSEYWVQGEDAPSFVLSAGTYSFYVLCNAGDVAAPGPAPSTFRYRINSTSEMISNGIPMAACEQIEVSPSTSGVNLTARRLVSRYNLYVQRSYEDNDATFTVTGVRLCQAAADVLAFGSASVPEAVLSSSDGDIASAADISCLNSSVSYDSTTGAVSFYMLENAGGTLLPGNTDPWKKCFDSYGGLLTAEQASKLTYVELDGIWATSGASENLTYRMYLGRDNCSNFDIIRNRDNNITLTLSDTGKNRASWKVEEVSGSDSRSLAWSSNYLQIYRSGEYHTGLSVNPAGMSHNIYYAPNPSSPVWQRLVPVSEGHLGYYDPVNLVTLDYHLSSGMLVVSAVPSPSVTDLFTFAVKAQTTDERVSSGLTVDVASGVNVNYDFRCNWSVSTVEHVYSNAPSVLTLYGGPDGSLDSQVNLRYDVGYYPDDSCESFYVSSSKSYSVMSSVVREVSGSSAFYFDPSGNRAFFSTAFGTSAASSRTMFLRIYINGLLKEEHEVRSLSSWFVPSGDYVYGAAEFLDQSDDGNPPVLFVSGTESVYLRVFDGVGRKVLSPRLLFVPADMFYDGSDAYRQLEWDWNDMDENGISVVTEEDPEDHDLYFRITKTADGRTSNWNLGYAGTGAYGCLTIVTAASIPVADVSEVRVEMPDVIDNACAGAVSGRSSVIVDFSSAISSVPQLSAAPRWLSVSELSSFGYAPSDPEDLRIEYRRISDTTGELSFRRCFCGDVTLCWEDVHYTNLGKTGFRFKFNFKVRSVFDIGIIYLPVYYNSGTWSLNPVVRNNGTATTQKGIICMYPFVKDGTSGAEVFSSLVSHMKMRNYYASPVEYQWIPMDSDQLCLHGALQAARVEVKNMGSFDEVRIGHTQQLDNLEDLSLTGDYDWDQYNSLVDGELRQSYNISHSFGHSAVNVTSSVLDDNLHASVPLHALDGAYFRLWLGGVESPKVGVGGHFDHSDGAAHCYLRLNVVDDLYNTRFNAWPWNRIIYE